MKLLRVGATALRKKPSSFRKRQTDKKKQLFL
jgi:hypothetical protein